MKTLTESTQILSKKLPSFPAELIILGSGWNKILEDMTIENRISYQELFGIETSVPGHTGELIIGMLNTKRIACMSGRFHM